MDVTRQVTLARRSYALWRVERDGWAETDCSRRVQPPPPQAAPTTPLSTAASPLRHLTLPNPSEIEGRWRVLRRIIFYAYKKAQCP